MLSPNPVVYHFLAYRYFDQSTTCLDLLNFSDADVDSFNLTANKARGLNNWHVCADYLKKLDTPTPETHTQRRKFIYHVHSFNKTHAAHFRFYIRNLTADDVEYVNGLSKQGTAIAGAKKQSKMLIWATSCIEDEVREDAVEAYNSFTSVDMVEVSQLVMFARWSLECFTIARSGGMEFQPPPVPPSLFFSRTYLSIHLTEQILTSVFPSRLLSINVCGSIARHSARRRIKTSVESVMNSLSSSSK